MKHITTMFSICLLLLVAGIAAWLLGMGEALRTGFLSTHLLDVVMGFFCLVWLLVVLKVPWDLYFQAHEVAFEQQRARERNVAITAGREAYIATIKPKLLWLAIGAHLLSAALIAGITWFSHGRLGYYFAAFYLVSTVFRPAVAGYRYLAAKLQAIGEEAHYPREDVLVLKEKVFWTENAQRDLMNQIKDVREEINRNSEAIRNEATNREEQNRLLRQGLHSLSREFETTVSRLTDNQEVIKGIQAFVRLIAQSTQHPA